MSYYIKRELISDAEMQMLIRTGEWLDQLKAVRNAMALFIDAKAIKGAAAESIKSYINEEPAFIIDAMTKCIELFQTQMMTCANGYATLDDYIAAKIRTDRLKSISESLNLRNNNFYNTREAISGKLNSVSDIFVSSTPSDYVYIDIQGLKNRLSTISESIEDYETDHVRDMDEVNDTLTYLSSTLNLALSRTALYMRSYAKGSIPAADNMKYLADKVKKIEKEKKSPECKRSYVESIIATYTGASEEDVHNIWYTEAEINDIYDAYERETDKEKFIASLAVATIYQDDIEKFKLLLEHPELIDVMWIKNPILAGKEACGAALFNKTLWLSAITASLFGSPFQKYKDSKKSIAEENRENNKKTHIIDQAFVENQNDNEKYGNLKYGEGAFADTGCGPTAAYNALLKVSKNNINYTNPSLQDVLYDLEDVNLFNGSWGTSAEGINNYLNNQLDNTEYSAELHDRSNAFDCDRLMQNSDIGIIEFWNTDDISSGAHYVMIEKENGRLIPHNLNGSQDNYYSFTEMFEQEGMGSIISFILIH